MTKTVVMITTKTSILGEDSTYYRQFVANIISGCNICSVYCVFPNRKQEVAL